MKLRDRYLDAEGDGYMNTRSFDGGEDQDTHRRQCYQAAMKRIRKGLIEDERRRIRDLNPEVRMYNRKYKPGDKVIYDLCRSKPKVFIIKSPFIEAPSRNTIDCQAINPQTGKGTRLIGRRIIKKLA